MSFVHQFQTSEKIHVATQKMSKSGFFWNDKKSRFSLIVEQRFTNTTFKPILTEEVSRNEVEFLSLNEVNLITLLHVMNNFDEINYFFRSNYQKKKDFWWSSYEKS